MDEVCLLEGLRLIEKDHTKKLTSDGLDPDEYMYYKEKYGICYEDGTVIGLSSSLAYSKLLDLGWVKNHKFFIKPLESTESN